jgi:glucuronate isomerase
MKSFMDENFLLKNETAVKLYHEYAKAMPIFDYHCHLSPKEIAQDKKYKNITELWLGGDHYKWRAMRSNGVDERYITGDADDKEKFLKWAETMKYCLGNPLYHWAHLELKAYFGIDQILSSETAEGIWEKCNKMLQANDFSAKNLIKKSNVKVICTTDDPTDSLEYHMEILKDKAFEVKVLPTFRPDKGINIDKDTFLPWLKALSKVCGFEIKSFEDLKIAISKRIEFFHNAGCRLSDHGLEMVYYENSSEQEADLILGKAFVLQEISEKEARIFKTQVLLYLGKQYAKYGWTMQIHLGVNRNNNSRMMKLVGPDTGFDSIGDFNLSKMLVNFMDKLDATNELPKTILYSINPKDNEVLGTIIGSFQGGNIPGKIQFGSGWWFNDQKDGMLRQMLALANLGLLGRFVGMLTDSRSFISYTRHEYFRRILCNLLGEWAEDGEVPRDMNLLGGMVKDICFNNAKGYFGIEL